MRPVLVSQRVVVAEARGERLDALDQRWAEFLSSCGLTVLPVPNNPVAARDLLAGGDVAGIVLTGGNDLAVYGGDAPERDETEFALLEAAIEGRLPCLGVCRGMQVIQHRFGVPLENVEGHVTPEQDITVDGAARRVNSYHNLGARGSVPELRVWAVAADGTVKAVSHREHPLHGIMWHPERESPFDERDRAYIGALFANGARGPSA